jgi:hypothetical protein
MDIFSKKPKGHEKHQMVEGSSERMEAPRPWEDITLSAQKRYDSYKEVAEQKARDIVDAMSRPGITTEEQTAIRLNPESQFWYQELKQLRAETAEQFCERLDRDIIIARMFGRNFLGAAEWQREFQVDVGVVLPIPTSITKELLESDCPLHPGEKIKDTHILLLVPKTVNEEQYSAVKLWELCIGRKGSGEKLIDDADSSWKNEEWAKKSPAKSQWVLIPKADPIHSQVSSEKHFRSKRISEQEQVHQDHYKDYREAEALEVMTAALLNDLVNGKPRMLDNRNFLRCVEPNASGGRVCVGCFDTKGLLVPVNFGVSGTYDVGRALARKL